MRSNAHALLALMAFGASCEPAVCPDDGYEPVATFVEWGFIVPNSEGFVLVTGSDRSVQCHVIGPDGSLGERLCHVVDFDSATSTESSIRASRDRRLGVLPTPRGLRVVTKSFFIDVEFADTLARRVTKVVSPIAPSADGDFLIEAVFPEMEPVLVLWSFPTGVDREVRDLGVGRLVGDVIEIVGGPFYSGQARSVDGGFAATAFGGGRDPMTGHLWIDSPDLLHVLEFAEDGTLLQIGDHLPADSTAQLSLDDWVALPDGRWAVLGFGTALCTFEAIDRSSKRCFEITLTPPPDGVPHALDAQLLSDGRVLTAWDIAPAGPMPEPGTSEAIFLGTWDGDAGVQGRSWAYSLDQCRCTGCGGGIAWF